MVVVMRLINLFSIIVFFSFPIFSQIPNSGFEDWTTDPYGNYSPVGWQTTNSFPMVNVEPFTPGCQGNFTMKVKTINIWFPFPGVAIMETAYNFAQAPTKFSACVKSNIMPGDIAYIIVALMKGDGIIASIDSCTFKVDSTFSQFTYREFPIALQSNLVPDSLVIMVLSGLLNGQVGTEIIIDDVAFSGVSSSVALEDKNLPGTFVLNQNYPNPFNPSTTIQFSIPEHAFVKLEVFNTLGEKISTFVQEELNAGNYKYEWNAENLSSGVYLYHLQSGGFIQSKKLVLLK